MIIGVFDNVFLRIALKVLLARLCSVSIFWTIPIMDGCLLSNLGKIFTYERWFGLVTLDLVIRGSSSSVYCVKLVNGRFFDDGYCECEINDSKFKLFIKTFTASVETS
jgi:hypothetical protein